MALYFLKEVAFCVLLAAALVVLMGVSALSWKAAEKLLGGIRHARVGLTQGRLSEGVLSSTRHAILTFSRALQWASAAVEAKLNSNTA